MYGTGPEETGSRKVLEILNHYGHSISYHTVEVLETDLTTNVSDRHCTTPEGITKLPGLCMGITWNNYDENTETLSGANTIHDTVGIWYQNVPSDSICSTDDVQSACPISQHGPRRGKSKSSLI